ncbi:hypothetical protein RIF29_24677 [Crotalaria pallida]|uniref:F-box domain-containing protein n=1 Tax=Crotalaria pallida TaxID=3830 RepID=A0AAN9EMN4_CROPI
MWGMWMGEILLKMGIEYREVIILQGNLAAYYNLVDLTDCCEARMAGMEVNEPNPISKKMKNGFLACQSVDTAQAKASKDRFDDLPYNLIQHILSFMKTKDAIQTCVLAKRWKSLWVSIHCLYFDSRSFLRLIDFKKFVLWVLSRRDSSKVKVLIYSRIGENGTTDQDLLNKVI